MSNNVRKCNAQKRQIATSKIKKKYRIFCKTTENAVLYPVESHFPRMPCEPSYNLHEMQEESTVYGHLRGVYTKNHTKNTKRDPPAKCAGQSIISRISYRNSCRSGRRHHSLYRRAGGCKSPSLSMRSCGRAGPELRSPGRQLRTSPWRSSAGAGDM